MAVLEAACEIESKAEKVGAAHSRTQSYIRETGGVSTRRRLQSWLTACRASRCRWEPWDQGKTSADLQTSRRLDETSRKMLGSVFGLGMLHPASVWGVAELNGFGQGSNLDAS